MSPNSLYTDTNLYGGIPVSSGDFIKIFCDIERTIKVRRSIIKLEITHSTRESNTLYYTLSDTNVILKVNGTAVRIRATSMDLSKIYMFNPQTDTFLCVVEQNIKVYGDIKSMTEKDKFAIMRNGKRRKAIASECKKRLDEVSEEIAGISEQEVDLEVFTTSTLNGVNQIEGVDNKVFN